MPELGRRDLGGQFPRRARLALAEVDDATSSRLLRPLVKRGNTATNAAPSIPTVCPRLGLADHPDYKIKSELGRGGMGVVYLCITSC